MDKFKFEIYMSTDGKHTIHAGADTVEEFDKVVGVVKQHFEKMYIEQKEKANLKTNFNKAGGSVDSKTQYADRFTSEGKMCPIHNVPMVERTGKFGKFYSHKAEEGWCNGKAK
jgi:hypothetical protein